jgi:hypothetical protein
MAPAIKEASTHTRPDGAAEPSWRIVRYVEAPDDLTALRELWKHPARRAVPRIRYAVEVEGERVAWGLRSRDAAVRWLARLKQPIQLAVPLEDGDEADHLDDAA